MERTLVPIEQVAGWAPQRFWRTENLLPLPVQPVVSRYTDYIIPATARTTQHQTAQLLMNTELKSTAETVVL